MKPSEEFPGRRVVQTVLFTDLVNATGLKQRLRDPLAVSCIQRHHDQFRSVLARFPSAREIDTQGDSFLVLFPLPSEAVRFALAWQDFLHTQNQQEELQLEDRMGIHTGEFFLLEGVAGHKSVDVSGLAVDLAARVMSLAKGRQIFVTRATYEAASQMLEVGDTTGRGTPNWVFHGALPLSNVAQPLEVWQVGHDTWMNLQPPFHASAVPSRICVERCSLPLEKHGWLLRSTVVRLPEAIPGVRLFAPSSTTDPTAPWTEVTSQAGTEREAPHPQMVCRVHGDTATPAQLYFEAVTRDGANDAWDLALQPVLRIVDPERLLRSGVLAALGERDALNTRELAQWLKTRLEASFHDRLSGRLPADLLSPIATPVTFWEGLLRDLVAPFGLALDLPLAPLWSSQDARQRQLLEEARQRQAQVAAAKERELEAAEALRRHEARMRESDEIREAERVALSRQSEKQSRLHQGQMEALQARQATERLQQQAEIAKAQNELRLRECEREWREADHRRALAELAGREYELTAELRQRQRAEELTALNHQAELAAATLHRPELARVQEQIRIAAARDKLEEIQHRRAQRQREADEAPALWRAAQAELRREQEQATQEAAAASRRFAQISEELCHSLDRLTQEVGGLNANFAQRFDVMEERLKEITGKLVLLLHSGQVPPAAVYAQAEHLHVHAELLHQAESHHAQLAADKPRLLTARTAEKWLDWGRHAGQIFSLRRLEATTRNLVSTLNVRRETFPILTVRIGDPNHLEMVAPLAGYVTLINPGTSGHFYLITPNDQIPSVRVNSHERLSSTDGLIRGGLPTQAGPDGDEYVVAFVTPQPLFVPADLTAADRPDGLSRWDPASEGLIDPFRHIAWEGVQRMEQQLRSFARGSWAVAVLRYLVEP